MRQRTEVHRQVLARPLQPRFDVLMTLRPYNFLQLSLLGLVLFGSVSACDNAAPPDSMMPVSDDRLCESRLSISGQFAIGAPQPSDVFGCWPVGTWTFSAALDQSAPNTCTSAPELEAEYSFLVERDADEGESYTYLNNPSYERVQMKVTSGGGGLCEGGFEIYSPDGLRILNLKPALQADHTINGFAEYYVYERDQWN